MNIILSSCNKTPFLFFFFFFRVACAKIEKPRISIEMIRKKKRLFDIGLIYNNNLIII